MSDKNVTNLHTHLAIKKKDFLFRVSLVCVPRQKHAGKCTNLPCQNDVYFLSYKKS